MWVTVARCSSCDRAEHTTYGRCLIVQVGRFMFELAVTRRCD